MTSPQQRPNPYVGPRAFQTGEKIYGRDREVRELLDLLIAERIVVLYSPSGAGKSSLLQAGLTPVLEEEGFRILPVVRVNLEPPGELPKDEEFNRYVYSVLMSLEEDLDEEQHTPSEQLASMTLTEYLASCPREEGDPENEVLIFDQFEEILTLNPTDREGKHAFFNQLGAALRDRNRWALFSLREDFVASLDPYLRPIPTRFANKFRLDLLGRNASRQAIQQPAREAGVDFVDSATGKLIDDLRRVLVQQPDGSLQEQLGPHVEPVQLQVVCYRLWTNLSPDETQITEEHLASVGDVDQSLADYYAEKVAEIAQQTKVSERAIRQWMERQLITEGGFRGQVLMGEGDSEGLDNQAIFLLLDAHLIRGEKRRGATWFELAHDRLINPVRRDNAVWTQTHLSTLQIQATLWEQQDRSENLFLRDQALLEAEQWAAEHPEELNETDREFLDACLELRAREEEARAAKEREERLKLEAAQKVAEAERQRAEEQAKSATRLRRRAYILGVVLVITLALAGLAFFLFQESQAQRVIAENQRSAAEAASKLAVENEDIAQANAAQAEANAAEAEAASIRANQNAATAEAASDHALAQQATAEYNAQVAQTQEAIAIAQANLARSRELASVALTFIRDNNALNMLLSKEALDIFETGQALDAILRGLQYNLGRKAERYDQVIPPQPIEIFAVAASPDGNRVAWAGASGLIQLWDLVEGEEAWNKLATSGATINAIAYSQDGSFIVIGDDAGGLSLLDSETGDRLRNFESNIQKVSSLAISPDGSTIAYGGRNEGTSANIYTRNLETNEVRDFRIREGEVAEVFALAWSPDGKLLVSGGPDRIVHIWDPETGREVDRLEDWIVNSQFEFIFEGPIRSLAFSPNGKWLVTGAEDNQGAPDRSLLAWDTSTWEEVDPRPFIDPQETLRAMRFSPDGQTLVSGYENGEVVIWNFNNQQASEPLKDHTFMITDLAFSQFEDSLLLVSVGRDRTVAMNNLIALQSLDTIISEDKGDSPRLAVAVEDELLVAGNTGDGLSLWELNPLSGDEAQVAQGPQVLDGDYQLSVDGTHLAVVEPGEHILVRDLNSNQEFTIDLPEVTVTTVNANGETSSTEELATIDSLTFNPDNSILAGSYCGERKTTVDPETEQESQTCVHSDINLWQIATGEREEHIITDQSSAILSLAFDPTDENILAVGYQNGIIQFCDLAQGGAAGLPLVGSGGPVTSLAYHRDGDILVSGTANNLIALWNLNPLQLIGDPMVGADGSVTSLALGEDHSRLYSASDQGTIQLWDLEQWKQIACDIAGRNMYPNEWDQFFPGQDYRATCDQYPVGTPEPPTQATATPTP